MNRNIRIKIKIMIVKYVLIGKKVIKTTIVNQMMNTRTTQITLPI